MRKSIILSFILLVLGAVMFLGCSDECEPYDDSYLCNPDIPVVLNGITIPEGKIKRGSYGCVTEIRLYSMNISDPNCLHGIEEYSSMLEVVHLSINQLTSIDLSPLSTCGKLEALAIPMNSLSSIDVSPLSGCENLYGLDFSWNNLTSIDLSPIVSCSNMYSFDLAGNVYLSNIDISIFENFENLYSINLTSIYLDSSTCVQICEFAENHPYCNIQSDCDCP